MMTIGRPQRPDLPSVYSPAHWLNIWTSCCPPVLSYVHSWSASNSTTAQHFSNPPVQECKECLVRTRCQTFGLRRLALPKRPSTRRLPSVWRPDARSCPNPDDSPSSSSKRHVRCAATRHLFEAAPRRGINENSMDGRVP